MAENKTVASNGTTPTLSCEVSGCYKHFDGQTNSKNKMHLFTVHFTSAEQIEAHAVESMCRVVAAYERMHEEESAAIFGDYTKRVHIYHDMTPARSVDAEAARIASLPDAERKRVLAEMRAILAASEK